MARKKATKKASSKRVPAGAFDVYRATITPKRGRVIDTAGGIIGTLNITDPDLTTGRLEKLLVKGLVTVVPEGAEIPGAVTVEKPATDDDQGNQSGDQAGQDDQDGDDGAGGSDNAAGGE